MVSNLPRLVGIFGNPLGHSLSPQMQNAAFAALGINYTYFPFQVLPEQLHQAVLAMKALNFAGANVTIPYKEAVIPYLDWLSREAELIGAVNTIVYHNGELIGYNTDGEGFLMSLGKDLGMSPAGKRVVLLGAGGATRAVAVTLGSNGAAEITIANRTKSKADELARYTSSVTGCRTRAVLLEKRDLQDLLLSADLLINCTPVGMYPKEGLSPLDSNLLKPHLTVIDLIYRPRETALLRAAQAIGCRTLDGLGMLLYQGALAFKLWTDREPPVDIMRKALIAGLNKVIS